MAPKRRAAASLPSERSIAITERAPHRDAPCTLLSPTPPVPTTTTSEPAGTCAVLNTAPRPVMTPQASSDALANGTSLGIVTTCETWTVTRSAKAPVRMAWWIGAPSSAVERPLGVEAEAAGAQDRLALERSSGRRRRSGSA